MEVKSVVMVLADISGYTSFMKYHRTSLIHAELIITDLIESVLDSADHPLTINKLEGDAVFFFAETGENSREVAQSVLDQMEQFFTVFHNRENEIVSCNLCKCEACLQADQLRLKVIAHSGEALFKDVRGFMELAGEDVILIHRLLKNSVDADEYLLLTEAFADLLEDKPEWTSQPIVEHYDSLGDVHVTAYYPSGHAGRELTPYKATLFAKLKQFVRFETYLFGRHLGLLAPRRPANIPVANPLGDLRAHERS
ncbi:MAG: DUF2652 domain-containing protein [Chloroflexi bacterium]|nr:DUF2652 domain-containing protein [Chloroflexota bacterium]